MIVTVTLNIINVPPTLSSSFNAAERLYSTGQEIVDPTISIEDPDNTQMTSATVRISQGYISGQDVLSLQATGNITASFNSINGTLTLSGAEEISVYQTALRNVSYENTSTAPNTSTRTISFTINDGIDDSNTLNVAVNFNLPPVIQAIFQPTRTGNLVIIDLTSLISDPNNNLDISTLQIVSPPISGASASINSNNQLAIDYTGINFSGTDRLSIRVCDNLGACTIQELSFQIEGEIVVYNGISPNNDGRNDYLEIINLPAENKVSIFNRWGDLVYDIENYNNTTRRFEGIGNSGNELPNGVYFYKIEFKNGSSTLTGFLTIKR